MTASLGPPDEDWLAALVLDTEDSPPELPLEPGLEDVPGLRPLLATEVRSRTKLTHWTTMKNRRPVEMLIPGMLPRNAVCILYGDPEAGKSFLAVLLAVTVAAGLEWEGVTVMQGAVVYVVAEGGNGIPERIDAAGRQLCVDVDGLPIHTLDGPINLNNNGETDRFISDLGALGIEVALVIFDTYGRCTPGESGSAFDPAVTNATFANLERIRAATGATVLALDHPNNSDKKRPSNSFVKMAASDAVWHIEWDKEADLRVVRPVKLKDFPRDPNESLTFKLQSVRGGGACLVPKIESFDDVTNNKHERACLAALNDIALDKGATDTEWKGAAKDANVSRTSYYRARKRLVRGHLVEEIKNRYRLTAGGLSLVSPGPDGGPIGTD